MWINNFIEIPLPHSHFTFNFFTKTIRYTEEEQLHQQLAAMLTSIFVEAEEKDFHRHLIKLFPLVTKIMSSISTSKEAEHESIEIGIFFVTN